MSALRVRPAGIVNRVLGAIALAALIRTLFYASLDAFTFHLFGDPHPGRSGPDRIVSVPTPHAIEDHRRIDPQNHPLLQSQVA